MYSFITKNGEYQGLQITVDSPLNEAHKAVTTIQVDPKTYKAHFKIDVQKETPSRQGSPGSPMQVELPVVLVQ